MQSASPHGARQACDFSRRLALGPQQHKEGGDLRGVGARQQCLAGSHAVTSTTRRRARSEARGAHPKRVLGLLLRQVLAGQECFDHLHTSDTRLQQQLASSLRDTRHAPRGWSSSRLRLPGRAARRCPSHGGHSSLAGPSAGRQQLGLDWQRHARRCWSPAAALQERSGVCRARRWRPVRS